MSSSFSFKRLGNLITKQFFENSRLYGFSVLALFGLLGIAFGLWLAGGGSHYQEEITYVIFFLGLFITGSIFASLSFNMLGSKEKGIYWLSLPATHLEKLICTILYTTVAFTIVYCLCYFLVKSAAITFLESYIKKHPENSYRQIPGSSEEFKTTIKYFFYGYFAVQSLYLMGSVYFSRYSFIITSVIAALVIFAFIYYISKLQDTMIGPAGWDLVEVKKYDENVHDGYKLYSISPAISQTIKYIMQFAWAPLFWIVTWFRLQEKEI